MDEFRRFDNFAQRDGLPFIVRNFDADGGLPGNALDEDGFRLQSKAQVFRQTDNAAVLDAGFGLEFERGDDRPRVDLRDAPLDVKFEALGFNRPRALLQFVFIEFLAALTFAQQRGGRELVIRAAPRNLGLGCFLG